MRLLKRKVLTIFTATFLFLPLALQAKTWTETVAEVENKAEQLWEKGRALGGPTALGTLLNEHDIPKHKCAILGRLLGLQQHVNALEENPEPTLSSQPTEDELFLYMLHAHSLNNWVLVARDILERSDTERRQAWNLDCVGQMNIPPSAALEVSERKAGFRISNNSLVVLGDIEAGFSKELEIWLDENPLLDTVVLGSGGGNVVEALQAGLLIRSRGLDTTLSSNCYSACPLVFLGGVNRVIWSPYPLLGFHQMSDGEGNAVKPSHELYAAIEKYSAIMGADPNFLLASMLRASPAEMFEPDMNQLCEAKFTTWIQRICF